MKLTATGYQAVPPDYQEAKRALGILIEPGQTFELRALPFGRSAVCKTAADALEAIKAFEHAAGVYYTLNPCRPGLEGAARNGDILRRRWLPVDIDPVRPADTSSTDDEKAAAADVATKIIDDRAAAGWAAPIMIDSGNGYHLLWRVDLPADKLTQQWIKKTLEALARFSTEQAKVDLSVHNAARIFKLPGTWARKGVDSPDRPHRMARLLYVPEPLEIVTTAHLRALVDRPKGEAEKHHAPLRIKATGEGRSVDAYCRAALAAECAAVALEPDGGRNARLNLAAFKLGGLVHLGVLARQEIESSLTHAAKRSGLSDREISLTIKSGLDAGILEPREGPQEEPKKRPAVAVMNGESIILRASDVVPKSVEWLWPDRVPIGKLTTFAGWGGLGKSFVTMDLAARISCGAEIPGMTGECFKQSNVLILNTEDDPDDTSVPRLIEAGANLDRIAFLKSKVLGHFTLSDLEVLDRALDETRDVSMVVIDPATAHLGEANDHKNAELRGLLMPLGLWAMERRVAVVLVTHVNKPSAGKVEAAARVVGSVAWVNAVRAAVMFCRDPQDKSRRLFIPFKANNAPEKKGLAYRVESTATLARVAWEGEVETTADEAMNGDKDATRGETAAGVVTQCFREHREWLSDDLKKRISGAGLKQRAIFEKEVQSLPIRRRPGPGGKWVWIAEEGWPPPPET